MKAWIGVQQAPWLPPAVGEPILPLEELVEQGWEQARKQSGKHPFEWIEIEVDRCQHISGCAPCTSVALGSAKCHNSWATCLDKENFSSHPFWLRFCDPVAGVPLKFEFEDEGLDNFLPHMKGVDHSPANPDPGQSLGQRAKFAVTLLDAPHHDVGVDKYADERSYEPLRQGTLLRKLRARFPHYVGRRLRWYQGYLTDAPSLADFRKREYVMERWVGPDQRGQVSIESKDVLKILDDDRAQAPGKSKGELVDPMTAVATPSTLDISTTDDTEYDLEDDETECYVRISQEVCTYTGTTPISGGVRLTGFSRTTPSPYSTTKAAHSIGDAVQRCVYLSGTIPAVLRKLMVPYGGMDPSFIPIEEWELEADTYLAGDTIARLVTEPEGVKQLISEIMEQTLVWGLWFDEVRQKIRFRAVRPADQNDTVKELSDDANVVADSLKVTDDPGKVINEIQVQYAQVDPTKGKEEVDNYARGLLAADADNQSTNELGQRRIKRIFARWQQAASSAIVLRNASRTLSSLSKNLMTVQFKLERKDENLKTSDFADLTTLYIIDQFGAPRTVRVRVTRVEAKGEEVSYTAREDFFKFSYGVLAPVDLEGLSWDSATAEQKAKYMFMAGADGKFTNGDEGKALQ